MRKKTFTSLDEIEAERERKREAHRVASYRSRHRTELDQARQVVAIYEESLQDHPDDKTLLTKIQYWREKVAIHVIALTTGKRIRPQNTLSLEEQRLLDQDRIDIAERRKSEYEIDAEVMARAADRASRQRAESQGVDYDAELSELLQKKDNISDADRELTERLLKDVKI